MAKVPVNPFVLLSRRWYKVAAEGTSTARVQPAVATMRRTATTESSGSGSSSGTIADDQQKKQVFWMRDPKTGNWVPENHFDEIDVAELREKLLNKHKL